MCEESKELFHSLLVSIWYQTDEEMSVLLQEVIDRINGNYTNWSTSGNLIYGTLICVYGEYETEKEVWLAYLDEILNGGDNNE